MRSPSAMEDQNHGLTTFHGQKTMVDYRTRKEGEIAPRDASCPTMRALPDSESVMYRKAVKGAVMIKPNPRGEYDAMDEVQNWVKRADWRTERVTHTYRNYEEGTAQEMVGDNGHE